MILAPALAKSGISLSTGATIKCTSIGAVTPCFLKASHTSHPMVRLVQNGVHDIKMHYIVAIAEVLIGWPNGPQFQMKRWRGAIGDSSMFLSSV